jgi:glycosyltransferase involved in cell wall biosynthesis
MKGATALATLAGDVRPARYTGGGAAPRRRRIAYFVNLFPNLIETMIYREVGALRALGTQVFTFSIRRPDRSEVSAEAHRFFEGTTYILPVGLLRLLLRHLGALLRNPVRYWTILFEVLRGTHTRFRDRLRTLCHFAEAVTVLPDVRRLEVDQLHAHWAVGSATVAMVVSRFLDIPFTFTAHAYDIWRERLLLPEKLRAARLVVTCTEYNRRHLQETYGAPADRFRVVYHGVDLDRFQRPDQPQNACPLILSVGRLVEQKGFDRLLQACAEIARDGVDFRCEIVGDGPLRRPLEELAAELGLGDRVHFAGKLFQEDLIRHYAAADVFALLCMPASDEDRDGIPNTLIEAMAMELPVVSTTFTGVPELVTHGETGLLVETDDVAGAARSLISLLGDAERRREMGEAGRRRVAADFTIAGSARRLNDAFHALSPTAPGKDAVC